MRLFSSILLISVLACGGAGDGSTSPPPGGHGVAAIAVDHTTASMEVGAQLQLIATARDAAGAIIAGQSVNWTSTDHNVLDVSATGLVTAITPGSATIAASVGNVMANVPITVHLPAAARYAIDSIGNVLSASSFGLVPDNNNGTADVSAIELPDKRIRLYFNFFTSDPGAIATIHSAISTDGIHFTVEPGIRQPASASAIEGFSSPFIIALPGGGYRLFYGGCHGIFCGVSSSTSNDGLTFVADPKGDLPELTTLNQPACAGIVKLADGRYRMYCSQEVQANAIGPREANAIFSATSPDLVTWTLDPGRRIGQGSPALLNDADHPTAIVNADGSVSLIYYQHRANAITPREMISTSTDGLTFTTEYDLGFVGTEPALVVRSDGSMLLYYGQQTPTTGSTIGVARVTPIVH